MGVHCTRGLFFYVQNESEATAIPGIEAGTADQSDENGLFAVMWKSTAALTDGQYTYDITFTRIVLASPENGTFCVGEYYYITMIITIENIVKKCI